MSVFWLLFLQHSGIWLHAHPLFRANPVLMMSPSVLQWVCDWGRTFVPHMHEAVALVDLRFLICKQAPNHIARHHALNDTGISVINEPIKLARHDGK